MNLFLAFIHTKSELSHHFIENDKCNGTKNPLYHYETEDYFVIN